MRKTILRRKEFSGEIVPAKGWDQINATKQRIQSNISYTSYYNWKHDRAGHLYQGRYKSFLVDVDSYLQAVSVMRKMLSMLPVSTISNINAEANNLTLNSEGLMKWVFQKYPIRRPQGELIQTY